MHPSWFIGLLGPLLCAASLRVARVEREGLPPYEDGEKVYRIEGSGVAALKVGEILALRRIGEKRNLGRIQITVVKDGYAQARLAVPGETYLLKGDGVLRSDAYAQMPALPREVLAELGPVPSVLEPKKTAGLPPSLVLRPRHREPIYFLKGSASLSPAALAKLGDWALRWGTAGVWQVACPQGRDASLDQARMEALCQELGKRGVVHQDGISLPSEAPGRYDVVYVMKF